VRYFFYFIVGLIALNFVGTEVILLKDLYSYQENWKFVGGAFESVFGLFMLNWVLVISGIVFVPTFLFTPTLPIELVVGRTIVWILAIISIPISIKLTKGMPKLARVFLPYFISVNLAGMWYLVWFPDFGG